MRSDDSRFMDMHNEYLDPDTGQEEVITKEEALEALDILSAQIGSARLREMWKAPIRAFIEAQECDHDKEDASDDENDS